METNDFLQRGDKYQKCWSSMQPGLIIILIDQSKDMSDKCVSKHYPQSKAEIASMSVNRMINEMIIANLRGDIIKPQCFIAVIGYGNGLVTLVADFIDSVVNNLIRLDELTKNESDGAGGIIQIPYEVPIWIEPKADNGCPMGEAFGEARKVVKAWVEKYPDGPAPSVCNITAGLPDNEWSVRLEAAEIKKLKTTDGNTLVFNSLIDDSDEEIIFPNERGLLSNLKTQFLFDISSMIPSAKIENVQKAGFTVSSSALGCIINSDFSIFVRLLEFGS